MSFPLLSDHAIRYVTQDAETGWPSRPDGSGPVFYFGWTEPTGLQALDLWYPIDEPNEPFAPIVTDAGTITEPFTVGSAASVSAPTASGNPSPTFAYQWQRDTGSGFASISGATSAGYTYVEADEGHEVRRQVIATNSEGSSDPAFTNAITVLEAPAEPEGDFKADWLGAEDSDPYGDLSHIAQNSDGTGAVSENNDLIGWAEDVV